MEHGCDGSNTTQLVFQIPAGITDAAPVERAGWTTSVGGDSAAGQTVTFGEGNLDAATPSTFQLTFTAPAKPSTIRFARRRTGSGGDVPSD